MNEAIAVVGVFALVLVIGLALRQWTRRRLAATGTAEHHDLADLADPSRWPAPPPVGDADVDLGGGADGSDSSERGTADDGDE